MSSRFHGDSNIQGKKQSHAFHTFSPLKVLKQPKNPQQTYLYKLTTQNIKWSVCICMTHRTFTESVNIFHNNIISDSTTVFLLKCVACKGFHYKKWHLFLYFLSNTTAFRHLKSCVSGSGFVSDRPPPQVSGLLSSESIPMITAEPHPDTLSLQTADIPRTHSTSLWCHRLPANQIAALQQHWTQCYCAGLPVYHCNWWSY